MTRLRAGRILLGVGAALNILSMLFPWDDPTNHFYKLCFDSEFFVDCARAGSWWAGLRLLAEGLGCISPSLLGAILLLAALLPRGRVNAVVSSLLHIALLLMLAAVAWVLFGYDIGAEGADHRFQVATGGGAVLLSLLALLEVHIARKSVFGTSTFSRDLGRAGRSGDAAHILPLIVYFLAGTGLAIALRGSEVWHSVDYAIIGVGSALALVGLWLRRPAGAIETSPEAQRCDTGPPSVSNDAS